MIFELLCYGILVFLELQYHLNLMSVLIAIGLLIMSILLLSLAHDFHGIPEKLCIILALLLYPFSSYFFSQLPIPSGTLWNLLIFLLIRTFIGIWLLFYDGLRKFKIFQNRELLLMLLLSIYFGLTANLLQVYSINIYEYLQNLRLPPVHPLKVDRFLILTAIHFLYALSMRALRQFQK